MKLHNHDFIPNTETSKQKYDRVKHTGPGKEYFDRAPRPSVSILSDPINIRPIRAPRHTTKRRGLGSYLTNKERFQSNRRTPSGRTESRPNIQNIKSK